MDMGTGSRTLAFYLCGASQQDTDLYVMINASNQNESFHIQQGRLGEWRQVFRHGSCQPGRLSRARGQALC